jgi:HK97 family phage prohead protease
MSKHTLLTREESLRARDLIKERIGHDRVLKITAAALSKGAEEGTFVGYASTFETDPDLAGDVVARGAFTQSIADWRARGSWPPVLWNHDTDDPNAAIGVVTDMKEDGRGLLVSGVLDLSHPPAEAVWRAMKSGRITTFSFAYSILQEHRREPDFVNVLEVLDVLEVSVTPKPANRSARLVSLKGANTSTAGSNATVTWSAEPESELDRINARLDPLASNERPRDPAIAKQVDELILATRLELVQEALDRAEQAAWESRIQLNAVLDPVPVRVDARMRPVTS